jgi:hypothetical protein
MKPDMVVAAGVETEVWGIVVVEGLWELQMEASQKMYCDFGWDEVGLGVGVACDGWVCGNGGVVMIGN